MIWVREVKEKGNGFIIRVAGEEFEASFWFKSPDYAPELISKSNYFGRNLNIPPFTLNKMRSRAIAVARDRFGRKKAKKRQLSFTF